MNEQTYMSVLNNIQRKISIKRQQADEQLALLLNEPTLANLQAYQLLISDFISFAVTQIYLSGLKAHWPALSASNLYDEVSSMDEILNDISQSIISDDTANLSSHCREIQSLLDKFTQIKV